MSHASRDAVEEPGTCVVVISVVLNDVSGLRRTVTSVKGQSWEPTVHIVVDGGSSDGSLEFAQTARGRHDMVLPGPDSGIFNGMNRGLAAAPDDSLVWFLNAGDFFLHENAIRDAVVLLEDQSDWCGGPIAIMSRSGALLYTTDLGDGGTRNRRASTHVTPPPQPSVLAPKHLLVDQGGFDERFKLGADGVLFQDLAQRRLPRLYRNPAVGFVEGGRSSTGVAAAMGDYWDAGYGSQGRARRILESILLRTKARARGLTHAEGAKGSTTLSRFVTYWIQRRHHTRPLTSHWATHPAQVLAYPCCLYMGEGDDVPAVRHTQTFDDSSGEGSEAPND